MASHYRGPHSKTWRIKWYDEFGIPRSESAHTTDESVARKLAKKKTAELELGLAPSQLVKVQKYSYRLTEAFEEFLKAKNFGSVYVKAHRNAFRNILTASGNKYVHEYCQTDFDHLMEVFQSVRRSPITTHVNDRTTIKYKELFLSENTIANYTRHLHVFFEWMLKKKMVKENFIIKAKEKLDDPEPIPEEDQKRIFDYLYKTNKKYYDLFKLMYLGAYRSSELCNVYSTDFEFNNMIIKVRNFKAKRTDRIPLLKDIKGHLLQMNFEGQLTHLTYSGLKSLWERVMKGVNKEHQFNNERRMKYHLHQLRKSRGTDLANLGVDLLFLHKFMRHTSIEVTRKYYIKVNLDIARDMIDRKLDTKLDTTETPSRSALGHLPQKLRLVQ